MTDRDSTLQWLVQQARDHEGEGPFALHAPEVTSAKVIDGLRTGEVALSEELAWDLASSAITRWYLPPFPEFEELDNWERINLLNLSVALSIICKLQITPWLAMAAHRFSHEVNVGLGESGLPGLIETLRAHWIQRSGPSSVEDILASLELLIALTPENARVGPVIVSVTSVTSWLHYPNAFPKVPVDGFQLFSMHDWVNRWSKLVMEWPGAPDHFKLEAYRTACNSIYVSAHHALQQGSLASSDVISWYEKEVAGIRPPTLTDPNLQNILGETTERFSFGLAAITANWLLDHDRPLGAKKYVDWAYSEFPQLTDSP